MSDAPSAPVFYRRADQVVHLCEHCRGHFIAASSIQRFCNLSCASQANANKRREARDD